MENQSSLPICEIYFSPHQQTDFGENQLPEGEWIAGGSSQTFTLEAGVYDLLIRSCSEETLYSAAQISQNRSIIIGSQGNALFRVTNQTTQEICYLYISSNEEWGDDRLGKVESILPGSKRVFFLPPDIYHARALDCGENVLAEIGEVNLSDSFEWVISP
ncbi:hypothetical protein [Bellilinea caldifistulae]|uniref:hypothetical protein n=1 Tax=Bellilinea caldifistulae TaxID=360411 RepID=UPI0011AE8F60|nr:hypothetical protein [Bellilinea caldifistulae]